MAKSGAIFSSLCFILLLSPLLVWQAFSLPLQPLLVVRGLGVCLLVLGGWSMMEWRQGKLLSGRVTQADILLVGMWGYLFMAGGAHQVDSGMRFGWLGLGFWYILVRKVGDKSLGWVFYWLPGVVALQWGYSVWLQEYAGGASGQGLKICGTFQNTAMWGGFLALSFILIMGILLHKRWSWWQKGWLWIGIILGTGGLCVADSRAAWFSVVVGCSLLVWQKFRRQPGPWLVRYKWLGLGIVAGAVIYLGYWCYYYRPGSVDGRLLIWRSAWEMIKEKPFLGWGVDGFRKYYLLWQGQYLQETGLEKDVVLADNNFYAFNEILRIGVEYGCLGLCVVGGLVWLLLRRKSLKPIDRVAKAGFIGFIVFAQFSYPLSSWQLMILVTTCMAILAGNTPRVCGGRKIGYGLPILFIVAAGWWGTKMLPYNRAIQKWNSVMEQSTEEGKVVEMEKLTPDLATYPFFLQNYGRHLNLCADYSRANVVLHGALELYITYPALVEYGKSFEGLNEFAKADSCWRLAAKLVPVRFVPDHLRMLMFWRQGDRKMACVLAEQILSRKRKADSPELYAILRDAWQVKNGCQNP